jgi:hypothetical protein
MGGKVRNEGTIAAGMLRAQSYTVADEAVTLAQKYLSDLIERSNPDRGPEVADLLRERVIPAMREHVPEFVSVAAGVYSSHFTRADLDQLIAFYESPVGKKLFAEQGTILREMVEVAETWGRNRASEVLRALEHEFQERGLSMPSI